MKKTILSIGVLAATAAFSQAVTIQLVRAGGGTGFVTQTADGTALSAGGYYIGVGTFATAPVVTTEASLLQAISGFQQFTSFLSPLAGNATAGTITGSGTATTASFSSAPLYIVVGNAATLALSTQFAILVGTPGFVFPADLSAGAVSYTLANETSIDPIQGAGTEIVNAAGTPDVIRLRSVVVIPEPSVALLGAVGALGLLRRRRN